MKDENSGPDKSAWAVGGGLFLSAAIRIVFCGLFDSVAGLWPGAVGIACQNGEMIPVFVCSFPCES
jgi:hypothetical protein